MNLMTDHRLLTKALCAFDTQPLPRRAPKPGANSGHNRPNVAKSGHDHTSHLNDH